MNNIGFDFCCIGITKYSMKYLAIDFGLKRTGIAVTDDGGHMAFARSTITWGRNGTRATFFSTLMEIIQKEAPSAIVVGLPCAEDGTDSLTTRQVRNFVKSLKRRTTLPIFWMNERLSSFEALDRLHQAGVYGAKVEAVLDQQAAVCILESFLSMPEHTRIQA